MAQRLSRSGHQPRWTTRLPDLPAAICPLHATRHQPDVRRVSVVCPAPADGAVHPARDRPVSHARARPAPRARTRPSRCTLSSPNGGLRHSRSRAGSYVQIQADARDLPFDDAALTPSSARTCSSTFRRMSPSRTRWRVSSLRMASRSSRSPRTRTSRRLTRPSPPPRPTASGSSGSTTTSGSTRRTSPTGSVRAFASVQRVDYAARFVPEKRHDMGLVEPSGDAERTSTCARRRRRRLERTQISPDQPRRAPPSRTACSARCFAAAD